MSPRSPVLRLDHWCLKLISNKLIHTLSDDGRKYYEVVAKYLEETTCEVLQDLMKIILNSVNLDACIRFNCLQLLLRGDVRKLDIGMFPQFYYEKILETIITQGKRIQHLNLKGLWVRDFPEKLSELIMKSVALETLLIPHMANDDVLEAISSLEHLTKLDICGEACYSVGAIRKLKSDTLRVLDIGNFGKVDLCPQESSGYDVMAEIIRNFPNLTTIRTYSYTGHSLLLIYNKTPTYKTKLKYLHDTFTTSEIVESISNLCPNLENIHLDSPESGVVEKLTKLKKLHSIKLTKCKVHDVLKYLKVSGSQLQVLKLNHNKNTSLDLSEICLFAPNLTTLECFQMKIKFSSSDTYFLSLQNAEMLYCDMSDEVTRFLLTNSPSLKRMVIGCITYMTDGDIFRLCAECDFGKLEELWFSHAKYLTCTAVELLMGHCPNLRVIGQLSTWDVHQEEIDYLRSVIASTNTDLILLPSGNIS